MKKVKHPTLRFKDSAHTDWTWVPLKELAERNIIKNTGHIVKTVLTNSAKRGVVPQQDYFDKAIANEKNTDKYYVVSINDFVYNPRVSELAPVGPIGRNKLVKGVMSPLYTVFTFNDSQLVDFAECYFKSSYWHRYIQSVSNVGARHDRMNISITDFMSLPVPLPCIEERKKIFSFIDVVERKIELLDKKVKLLNDYREGVYQKLFSQKVRFKDQAGNAFPNWKRYVLKDILCLQSDSVSMRDEETYELITVKRGFGGVKSRGYFKGKDILVKNQFTIHENEFVISKRQIVHGACGLVPAELEGAIVSNEYNVFRPVDELLDIDYFNRFATTPFMRRAFFINSDGVHIEKLLFKTQGWLKTKVQLPCLEEQRKIAQILQSIDRKIECVAKQVEQTKQFKKGLLQQMFV
ncbi:restriction endonuclease subunit S [Photobacterium leiognathi]|uniref:restriction endonuclease subunit S n=1 Tax=Photobacterium leiognathi TaxID=553611 RepID=UPI00076A2691|nr:restriction endonuclease subunit S [Photobacterium leiognathi]